MGDPDISNLLQCCRLCRSEKSLFNKSILDDRSLQQAILKACGKEVREEDQLPKQICIPCVNYVNQINKGDQFTDNQRKSEQMLYPQNSEDSSDMTIQTEKEPVDHGMISDSEDIEDEPTPMASETTDEDMELPMSNLSIIADDPGDDKAESGTVANPMLFKKKIPGKKCPVCAKEYSKNSNMHRHYNKIHLAEQEEHKETYNKSEHLESKTPRNETAALPITPNLQRAAPDDGNAHAEVKYNFTCEKCFKRFRIWGDLMFHPCVGITAVSPRLSPKNKVATEKVRCDMCHTAFDTPEKLDCHKAQDHPRTCSRSDTFHNGLNNKQEEMSFRCAICVKTFKYRIALKKHKEHHKKEKQPVESKNTSKVPFANLDQFKMHVNKVHLRKPEKLDKGEAKRYSCNICQKTFIKNTSLRAHQRSHKRGKTAKRLVKDFRAKYKFTKFADAMDKVKDDEAFPCNTCGFNFLNDATLTIHISEKHGNQQFHKACELPHQAKKSHPRSCAAPDFASPDGPSACAAQEHKYLCYLCDRAFDKRVHLWIHLQVHAKHEGVTRNASKPEFSCAISTKDSSRLQI